MFEENNPNLNNQEPIEESVEPATYSEPTENTPPPYIPYTPPTEEPDPESEHTAPVSTEPVWNKVNYTPTNPVLDYRPASLGLKIFAFVMACIILLSTACITGYFLGRNSVSSPKGSFVSVDLAAKPKNTDQMTPAEVYEKVNKSIVGIRIYNSAGSISDASGVIYSKEGYIVTNDHIYSEIGAPKFKIYMHDGTERTATYVAGDTVSDLAVLKLDDTADIEPAILGNSAELFCGENVVAVGRPSDATTNSSITSGIISLTSRRVQTTSNYSARLIQTDSAINPGSSGGALVNMYGQVVGITSSKLAGVEYDAIGFAIPTKTVKRVAQQLISDGKVTDRAKLGITYTELNSVTAEISEQSNVGLYVASVSEDSDLYGKLNEGDIITHVNGIKITNDDIVLDIIEDCVAGDSITLTAVTARGITNDYKVTLRANVGESSYTDVITTPSTDGGSSNSQGGGTFDFPFGE